MKNLLTIFIFAAFAFNKINAEENTNNLDYRPKKHIHCCKPKDNCCDEKLGESMMAWGLFIGISVAILTGCMHNDGPKTTTTGS